MTHSRTVASPIARPVHRRVLLVEDDPGDRDLVCEYLAEPGAEKIEVICVSRLSDARTELQAGGIDAVLLDLGLPDAVGLKGVVDIQVWAPSVPIVVLTGRDDDAMAVECLAAGAQDYLSKSEVRPRPLARAISHAVARSAEKTERDRADALQSRLAAIVEASSDAIFSLSDTGTVTSWNRGAALMFGYPTERAVGQPVADLIGRGSIADGAATATWAPSHLAMGTVDEVEARRLDGSILTLARAANAMLDANGPAGVAVVCRDVTADRRQASELRATNAHLQRGKSQLRQLATRLYAAREDERTRIAREVHDELGQLLTGIAMDLRWIERRLDGTNSAEPSALLAKLLEAAQLVDQTIASVQRIAVELRPSALDALGLVPAVRGEARRFESRSGVPVLVEVAGSFDTPPPEVATALFRILQELLTNVARHAQAHSVLISLTASPREWRMQVGDDGVGIDADVARRSESLGLLGMYERAIAIGGRFSIEPAHGGGTLATVEIPREGVDP